MAAGENLPKPIRTPLHEKKRRPGRKASRGFCFSRRTPPVILFQELYVRPVAVGPCRLAPTTRCCPPILQHYDLVPRRAVDNLDDIGPGFALEVVCGVVCGALIAKRASDAVDPYFVARCRA